MVFDAVEAMFEASVPEGLARPAGAPLAGPCLLSGRLRRTGARTWLEADAVEPLADAWGLARSA